MIVGMHPKRSSGDGEPRGDLEELPVTARRIEDEVSAARVDERNGRGIREELADGSAQWVRT